MRSITFKQYIESKERLKESIKSVPIVEVNYMMKKYCKFPVGEREDKDFVALKPNDNVAVTWKYLDPNNRVVESIVFKESDEGVFTYWRQEKVQKWIESNCVELVD